jgi:hypothetical protein
MSATGQRYRLDGLDPDNLLAFLSLLGLLRSLEEAAPAWRPRVAWSIAAPPTRPVLSLTEDVERAAVVTTAATGLNRLAELHDFASYRNLRLPQDVAAEKLRTAAVRDRYTADLWAALVSDATVRERNKTAEAEPTPFCLMFGQGHQYFLERLSVVPRRRMPDRGPRRSPLTVSEAECLTEALFSTWARPDATPSFRWDPHEDVRYAHRATDPTDQKTKETTQHGANRLAAVGLAALTVVPRRHAGEPRLEVLGGDRSADGSFCFSWPIWRDPISLAAIRALLGHPRLDDSSTRVALGIVGRRRTCRISSGKFMNFTPAAAR